MAYGSWVTSYPGKMRQRYWWAGALSSDLTSNKTLAYSTLTRTGALTPSYFSKRKKNTGASSDLLQENALSQTFVFDKYVFGTANAISWPASYIYEGCLSGVANMSHPSEGEASFSAGEINSMESRATTSLRLKLKDQKVNLLQVFAERKQTIDLVSSTAVTIAKMISAVKRGDLLTAGSVLGIRVSKRAALKHKRYFERYQDTIRRKNHPTAQVQKLDQLMANGVLQLNFGWKPLLSDIYGSAEQLADSTYREVWSQCHTKTVLYNEVQSKSTPPEFDWTQNGMRKRTVKYSVKFSVENLSSHTAAKTGLTNPLAVAWELVPWSFVIDWFLPVGNYLSSLDATVGMRFISGTKTTIFEYALKRDFVFQGAPRFINGTRWSSGSAVATKRGKTISRVKLTSFPSPVLPSFRNPFTVTRAINSIALLTQLRK